MNTPTPAWPAETSQWMPDQGDGTYRNPVLHADYSDPDVIRHGDDYWLTASSFTCTPGLPILHSRDLVNWRLVNHAVQQLPGARYAEVQTGCGIWAPSLRYHAGLFWIFFPMPDEGIFVTTAADPRGEWCEPWLLQAARGWIDPCPFWDDDGRAYLVHAYANSRAGLRDRLHLRPMAPDGRRLLGEGVELVHAPHHPYLEGPKLHRIAGWYYLLAPGGGVTHGWQVAFRSQTILGPYEEKVVLEQGSTEVNGPHQGALVDLPGGEWWFLHFQDLGPFGRVVHLQPVEWRDGWPLLGIDADGNGVGEPVAGGRKPSVAGPAERVAPATTDEFDGAVLGLQWQWHANHSAEWASLTARSGWLRLQAVACDNPASGVQPNFLGQKFPAPGFAVETVVDPAGLVRQERAGLAVVSGSHSVLLAVRRSGSGCEWLCCEDGRIVAAGELATGPTGLRVRVGLGGRFAFALGPDRGEWFGVPGSFQAVAGGWMGAKVGLVALRPAGTAFSGFADFDSFRFLP